jgi:hypothetical protein
MITKEDEMNKNEIFAHDAEFVIVNAFDFADDEAAADYFNELREIEFDEAVMRKEALAWENRFWWRDDMEVAA